MIRFWDRELVLKDTPLKFLSPTLDDHRENGVEKLPDVGKLFSGGDQISIKEVFCQGESSACQGAALIRPPPGYGPVEY
ncbi:hypothetical protein NQ318_011940 [Aromia moschata]|uniref:Uncharacterized protein n=1 Tax=Aromia moschata TaxID=1265417 RepID=A0AAV8X182_9CUCU|nr:hypothetical protein NQ318_011940 [Aromia moschata]